MVVLLLFSSYSCCYRCSFCCCSCRCSTAIAPLTVTVAFGDSAVVGGDSVVCLAVAVGWRCC